MSSQQYFVSDSTLDIFRWAGKTVLEYIGKEGRALCEPVEKRCFTQETVFRGEVSRRKREDAVGLVGARRRERKVPEGEDESEQSRDAFMGEPG